MSHRTDGKYYQLEELVRANCQDCIGCYDCCTGMGDTIVLDPYDVWMMRRVTGKTAQELLGEEKIALTITDGLILPHIMMKSETDECPFLNVEKRCSIHGYRPGMCRLFPLGRNYENGKLNYILLTEECKKKNRSKIKVSQWIGIRPAEEYQSFVLHWHDFRKKLISLFEDAQEEEIKTVNMYVLQTFYFMFDAPEDTFFEVFLQKMDNVERALDLN